MEVQVLVKSLVIVESPAKAKTIGKLLGRNYKVVASVGHVRDLPKSSLGIDIENNYSPKYITIRGKGPVIKDLKSAAKKVDNILLATDPDREGEAISWHLAHVLGIEDGEKVRVEFNEITKDAVKKAIKTPREIDLDLVDAQQARRILDRLVGYKISPLLWKKIRKGLSAGRVQSVAVKLICDRDQEIKEFIPEEYWSIVLEAEKDGLAYESKFYGREVDGKEEAMKLKSKDEVDKVINELDKKDFKVTKVKKGSKKRKAYPPFITSTLQQEASRKLGFNTRKTMMVAQQLYEGINGSEGLITYMRTDSTRISKDAVTAACAYIKEEFGPEYTKGGNSYSKGKKNSQDAHEAIRPTQISNNPNNLKKTLTKDQYNLYNLIWNRFISSQMTDAIYETMTITINNKGYIFRTTGSILKFDGYLKLYLREEEDRDNDLPQLELGELIKLIKIQENQHFTQPPARYTEASLIKTMEELGIGRPSTYAPTIGTILNRDYVRLDNKAFEPTELGLLVNELLIEYFENVINEKFTADLELALDDIADGNRQWKKVVDDFYKDFSVYLEKAEDEIEELEIKDEVSDEICEKCGKNMVYKYGRFGKFLACPGYPECKNTKAIVKELGVNCPKCDSPIVIRNTKKRRVFYGCKAYPDCDFTSWDEPIKDKCPECTSMMTIKRNKNSEVIKCTNEECGYSKTKEKDKG